MLVFIFLIWSGIAMSGYLGRKIGCIGYLIGFLAGIALVITVIIIFGLIVDTIGFLNFNRKSKLEQFSKRLKVPELDLRCGHVNDKNLDYILAHADLQLEKIKSLYLSHTGITDRSLDHFNCCKELNSINLDSTKITDRGLEKLDHFKKLSSIDLSYTKITGSGLGHLSNLKELSLSYRIRNKGYYAVKLIRYKLNCWPKKNGPKITFLEEKDNKIHIQTDKDEIVKIKFRTEDLYEKFSIPKGNKFSLIIKVIFHFLDAGDDPFEEESKEEERTCGWM